MHVYVIDRHTFKSKVVKFSAYTVYVIERHIQVAIVVKSIYMSSIDIFKWHGGEIKRTYMSSNDLFNGKLAN